MHPPVRRSFSRSIWEGLWWSTVASALAFAVPDLSVAADTKDPYELLEATSLTRDTKLGYILRADTWGGDLPIDGVKRIEHTLLRGNDYRFYAYTTTKGAKISFHVQDREGTVVETRCWQKEKAGLCFAGADMVPKSTGAYYLVIKVEQSTSERTDWSLVYAYK